MVRPVWVSLYWQCLYSVDNTVIKRISKRAVHGKSRNNNAI